MQRSVMRDSTTMRELYIRSRQLPFSKTTKRKDVHFEEKKKIDYYYFSQLNEVALQFFRFQFGAFSFWCKILLKLIEMMSQFCSQQCRSFRKFWFFFENQRFNRIVFSLGKARDTGKKLHFLSKEANYSVVGIQWQADKTIQKLKFSMLAEEISN